MIASTLAALPDSTPVYVPGVGEVTVGDIRGARPDAPDCDWRERTIKMWGWIATHPHEEWPGWENIGHTLVASGE